GSEHTVIRTPRSTRQPQSAHRISINSDSRDTNAAQPRLIVAVMRFPKALLIWKRKKGYPSNCRTLVKHREPKIGISASDGHPRAFEQQDAISRCSTSWSFRTFCGSTA